MKLKTENIGKPFVKWAGGKSQLLSQIDFVIPESYKKESFTYIEPFLGGGAVLFHLLNHYPNLQKAIVNDVNTDLIDTYKSIKNNVDELIGNLQKLQSEYYILLHSEEQKKNIIIVKEYFLIKEKLLELSNLHCLFF